ncbi:hypothetical protein K502DRAFT_325276 [Neoconidiobolus thromboides FSU 785]|nr:hypothetical protein K502DRAFT_325276 [Neoconidiobolus thromboides FSU 785]
MKQLSSKIGADFTSEDTVDGIKIEFRVMSVDLAKNKLESHLTFIPSNGLTTKYSRLSKDLLFNFNYYQKEFKANSTLSSIEITYPILEGSTSYYPFDEFSTLVEVEIINLEDQTAVPIELDLKASIASLKFSFNPIDDGNQHQKVILNIGRPGTVVFFSLFLFIVMWTLSLAVFMLALWTVAFSEERPGASYLGLGSALLFALPNLRSTQPGVPPIGALLDTIGFFW